MRRPPPPPEGHQRSQRTTSPVSLASMRWHPPPRPASGLLPRPSGRGQSWRYPRKAVSGRVNPCASSLFRFSPYTGPWEASPRGEGQTGRGQKPLPCLSGFNAPASPTPGGVAPEKPEDHPPCLSVSLASMRRHPPPHPASGLLPRPEGQGAKSPLPCLWVQCAGIPHPSRPPASSPAPRGGGSRGDTRGKPYPGE
jgi:hypothetical protein